MMFSHRFTASVFAVLLSASAFCATGAGAQTTVTSDPPATFTLGNGLQVLVIPDHRTPVVTQMIWYKVGSADEARGQSGVAHFLEHLMFKGTEKHPESAFSHAVAELGGQENAFTSYDYTSYFQRVAREHLKTVMAFEADRMTGLRLTDEVVDPEREVILEERRSRVDGDPSAQLGHALGGGGE
jgi:zinc protease